LHAAGVSPDEINAGARRLLAQAHGHQLAETRKQLGLGQKQIAAAMAVSVARVSQIEHGEVTSFEVIARTSRPSEAGLTSSPISATGRSGCPSATPHRRVTATAHDSFRLARAG
jgi:DNA-binding XRE family transcriptional regulator